MQRPLVRYLLETGTPLDAGALRGRHICAEAAAEFVALAVSLDGALAGSSSVVGAGRRTKAGASWSSTLNTAGARPHHGASARANSVAAFFTVWITDSLACSAMTVSVRSKNPVPP